jgi:hypothetical protein
LATPVFGPESGNKKSGEPAAPELFSTSFITLSVGPTSEGTEGYIQDVDPNQSQNAYDNNNQDIDINADLEEVVELPSKKQKQVMIAMERQQEERRTSRARTLLHIFYYSFSWTFLRRNLFIVPTYIFLLAFTVSFRA